MTTTAAAPAETSFPKSRIRVLLLENIHESAHEVFRHEGFQVETYAGALDEDALRREGSATCTSSASGAGPRSPTGRSPRLAAC